MSDVTTRREVLTLLAAAAAGACAPAATSPDARLAPPNALTLTVPPLIGGEAAAIEVRGATPGQQVWLGASQAGASGGPCPPWLAGACVALVPPIRVLGQAVADAAGLARFTFTVPAALVGATIWLQAVAATPAGVSAAAQATIEAAPQDTGAPTTCDEIPDETEGPYPDQTDMLHNPAFYRQDITEGRPGVPLTLNLQVLDTAQGCAPVAGAAVEIWHCDKDGAYSEYNNQVGATFLRGLQTTTAHGRVTFRTIYPGWYRGRVAHIHVKVWLADQVVKITQIAFPDAVNAAVQRSPLYAARGVSGLRNHTDGVFADGVQHELATLTGDVTAGFEASLEIGVVLV